MPAPSQLTIATSSLTRLTKEEASYHAEHEQQKARIAKLEAELSSSSGGDENAEFTLKQEVPLRFHHRLIAKCKANGCVMGVRGGHWRRRRRCFRR